MSKSIATYSLSFPKTAQNIVVLEAYSFADEENFPEDLRKIVLRPAITEQFAGDTEWVETTDLAGGTLIDPNEEHPTLPGIWADGAFGGDLRTNVLDGFTKVAEQFFKTVAPEIHVIDNAFRIILKGPSTLPMSNIAKAATDAARTQASTTQSKPGNKPRRSMRGQMLKNWF